MSLILVDLSSGSENDICMIRTEDSSGPSKDAIFITLALRFNPSFSYGTSPGMRFVNLPSFNFITHHQNCDLVYRVSTLSNDTIWCVSHRIKYSDGKVVAPPLYSPSGQPILNESVILDKIDSITDQDPSRSFPLFFDWDNEDREV